MPIFEILILLIFSLFLNILLKFLSSKLELSSLIRNESHHIHSNSIPRIGGIFFIISIFLLILLNSFLLKNSLTINELNYFFLLFILIFFFLGFTDDFFLLNNKVKFITLFLLVLFSVLIFNFNVYGLFEFHDSISGHFFKILFPTLCLFILIVSFNLIDGMNGLLNFYSILCLFNYLFINLFYLDNLDPILLIFAISLFTCILFNFPFAKLFMGDGAAYALAFIIGYYAFYLHGRTINVVNEWYYACLLSYPIMELLISFIRRILNKDSIFKPDKFHFHTLIYQNIQLKFNLTNKVANPVTTAIILIILIIYNSISIYYLFNNQSYLKFIFFFFCVLYVFMSTLLMISKNDK